MVSSVSSERAFSAAGITISKRRNRLKADVVEALQCLKCALGTELLFREDPLPAAEVESLSADPEDTTEAESWDIILEGADDLEAVDSDGVCILSLDD
ncbi:hypothetical protein IEO21_08480 [Rhodonia placenta]|uniref:HAT C-terminal dimerisation domain-containing protein n=1 Tax=Rhodonia placenta TaxID=104341 RepID=A0A8H7NW21_9APHY|nr:hypothetical protein IEO21_08480 [Postia placenta]